MKSINTSLFDFPRLRDAQSDYVYVDKTAQLYEIAMPTADCIYHLPRPRRFGKSLMLSTLKALFEGRRELFKGLAIEKTDWNWETEVYPVLHIDMSMVASKTADELEVSLQDLVQGLGASFGAPFESAKTAKTNFKNLLAHLATVSANGKYVVLIDEYDAPIAGLLDTSEGRGELQTVRKTLHDFYVQAKAQCGNMRFLMVTGVSKFAKTSIFSAFNIRATSRSTSARRICSATRTRRWRRTSTSTSGPLRTSSRFPTVRCSRSCWSGTTAISSVQTGS